MSTDLRSTIFNINLSSGSKLDTGSLLVAEPFLRESCFNHAVILVVDHGPGYSSMGLVLNKTTRYNLTDVIDEAPGRTDIPIYGGGPVGDDRMLYLHTLGSLFNNSIEVSPGLWIGGDYDQVLEYVNEGYPTEGLLRFYVGYAGWESGQLATEVKDNVWAVTQPRNAAELLTGDEDAFWHRTVRQMGDRYRGWQFHPLNPAMN